jgi:hypothetical protein
MGFTTFSGPLRSGTVKEGASINTGSPVLARSVSLDATVAKTSGAVAQALMTLPAGSKILDVYVEKTVAASGNSVSAIAMTIGDGTTADKYVTSVAIGVTAIRTLQATITAGYVPAEMNNIGTTDKTLYGTFAATTGNPTAGTIVLTVLYQQRSSTGLQDPATP